MNLLPIGTVVRVTPRSVRTLSGEVTEARTTYNGIVTGYDIHQTKYLIGMEYYPGLYTDGIKWEFPGDVTEIG